MKEQRMVTLHVGDGSPIITRKPDRNAKCRCGSGRKQKYCHGVTTEFFSTKPKEKIQENPDAEEVEHAVENPQ